MRRFQASVVSPSADGMITVQIPGKPTTDKLPCYRSLSGAAVKDLVDVWVDDTGSAVVVGLLGTAPTSSGSQAGGSLTPETAAAGAKSSGQIGVQATSVGTWRGNVWVTDTSDLISGDWAPYYGHVGVAYFGGQLAAAPGPLTSLYVVLTRKAGGASAAGAPTMTLLSGNSRPAGAPTVLATAPGPAMTIGQTVRWQVPAEWLSRLSAGGDAGGIGTRDNPYLRIDPAVRAEGTWST